MSQLLQATSETYADRRDPQSNTHPTEPERRQFSNSHADLSTDAQELANAIDKYKLVHRRRFITHEEMLGVVKTLGYHK